jgi:hypothetical protein
VSLVIDFVPPESALPGHWEQVDPQTLKWVVDDPAPCTVTSYTLEVFGNDSVTLKGGADGR